MMRILGVRYDKLMTLKFSLPLDVTTSIDGSLTLTVDYGQSKFIC